MTTREESNKKMNEIIRRMRGVTVVVPTNPANQAINDYIRVWSHRGEVVKPLDTGENPPVVPAPEPIPPANAGSGLAGPLVTDPTTTNELMNLIIRLRSGRWKV